MSATSGPFFGSQDLDDRESRIPDGRLESSAEPAARLEEAVQTAYGSLLALQVSLARINDVPGEHCRVEASLKAAIELIRHAIRDLRPSIPTGETSPLSLGFVRAR